jgi:hypothetical protein
VIFARVPPPLHPLAWSVPFWSVSFLFARCFAAVAIQSKMNWTNK